MTQTARPANRVLVVFGARGDLAARKLFPGLLHLFLAGLMPEDFRVIGSGRHAPDSDEAFRDHVHEALREHGRHEEGDERVRDFVRRVSFVASSADDGDELAAAVRAAEDELGDHGERLLYLSIPPRTMTDLVRMLGRTGLAEDAVVVAEKPFGTDVVSARELNAALHDVIDEERIYRIDHFLGKEAAQNIVAVRFANALFEPVWNREHIAYVQIDVPEDLDIEGRASFYEGTGAFRDMVVTHLLQVFALVALEPPVRVDAPGLHAERTKLFDSVRPLDPARVVFGQYEGYRDEDGVDDGSRVETFAALEVRVDTWRWSGVPFFLRTGKAMAAGRRTVTVGFYEPPLRMFALRDGVGDGARPNEIVFELSDDPEVTIDVLAKVPGPVLELGSAALRLDVEAAFAGDGGLEAYERLLHDVMLGDRTLFTRAEQIERLWEICQPVLDDPPAPLPYARGSWGPEPALALPGPRGWRLPDD
jgi:glucose-6-phosphate 1-dehydrogenase